MADVSPLIALGGFAGTLGTGLYIAKKVVGGYKRAKWDDEQRKLGLDKDLPAPPPAPPRLPPPAAAAVLPAPAPPPSRPSPPPPRVDHEMSRVALSMIEELQFTMRRQRVQLDKLEADTATKDSLIAALKAETDKQQEQLQRQRLSLDRLETENAMQATVIEGLRGETETLRRDIASGSHGQRDDRKPVAGSGTYRDYAGVRGNRDGGPLLRPQVDPVSRGPRGRKGQ